MSGIIVHNSETKQILKSILQNYGVILGENNELYLTTKSSTLIGSQHKLIQSIVAINNLFDLKGFL